MKGTKLAINYMGLKSNILIGIGKQMALKLITILLDVADNRPDMLDKVPLNAIVNVDEFPEGAVEAFDMTVSFNLLDKNLGPRIDNLEMVGVKKHQTTPQEG